MVIIGLWWTVINEEEVQSAANLAMGDEKVSNFVVRAMSSVTLISNIIDN